MDKDITNLLRTAFAAYLERLKDGGLEPSDKYLSYDFKTIKEIRWNLSFGDMVQNELCELINRLNSWQELLLRWQAWNSVINAYNEEDEAWKLRAEFLETLVHYCLFQPSAIRDNFTFVATNAMHQIRLMTDTSYKDYLEFDPKTPNEKTNYLTRNKKEKRLDKIISIWPDSIHFMTSLRKINNYAYQQETSDYRNTTSHSLGPRLGIGFICSVERSIVQTTEMTKQPDGKYRLIPVPKNMSLEYSYKQIAPLHMEKVRASNLEQYRYARNCFENYQKILITGLDSMPRRIIERDEETK